MTFTRFLDAQRKQYPKALEEIKNGKKKSHWIWYIFPQIKGLGFSKKSNYYGIVTLDDAKEYLENKVLGSRLVEISKALLEIEGKTAIEIFGRIDARKVQSSMTLFLCANPDMEVFRQVLKKYYDGKLDESTLKIIEGEIHGPRKIFRKIRRTKRRTVY